MALGKKPTTRIILTITEESLADLAGWSRVRDTSISEIIRQQILALGPPPSENERALVHQPAAKPVASGPKVDPDFNFGA